MTEFFYEYGLFAAKLGTFVVAILLIIWVSIMASRQVKKSMKGHIETSKINDEIDGMRFTLDAGVSEPESFKLHLKHKRKQKKQERKARLKALKKAVKSNPDHQPEDTDKKRMYVLDFKGDIRASAVSSLRREITAVLSLAREQDEVLVRLESPGGMVNAYGLAASQLQRVKQQGIALTICVDKVAASGGYMMACVADRILAAPFAMLGSIGVVAQLPNFNRLLKKHDIDYELITAGKYKRTLTVFGHNTDKGREKFVEDIEDLHALFKEFVGEHRPQLQIDEVATGEVWFGQRAMDHALVDELVTSDEYIVTACEHADVFSVKYIEKKSLAKRLGMAAQESVDTLLIRWLERGVFARFFS